MANTEKGEKENGKIKKKERNYVLAAFGLTASLGLNLAACILVSVAAGKYADGFFGTYPYLTVAGVVIGVLSGAWVIYKKIVNFEK